jgi:hypothetical protein
VLLLNECFLLLFISLSTQSGNLWIHPRMNAVMNLRFSWKVGNFLSNWATISFWSELSCRSTSRLAEWRRHAQDCPDRATWLAFGSSFIIRLSLYFPSNSLLPLSHCLPCNWRHISFCFQVRWGAADVAWHNSVHPASGPYSCFCPKINSVSRPHLLTSDTVLAGKPRFTCIPFTRLTNSA